MYMYRVSATKARGRLSYHLFLDPLELVDELVMELEEAMMSVSQGTF